MFLWHVHHCGVCVFPRKNEMSFPFRNVALALSALEVKPSTAVPGGILKLPSGYKVEVSVSVSRLNRLS